MRYNTLDDFVDAIGPACGTPLSLLLYRKTGRRGKMKIKGKLVLENGDAFEGEILTDSGIKAGMMVFDTRVVGHEKALTSPGYSGKIVCFTYPLIGNYGINYEDVESNTVFPSGIIRNIANYTATSGQSVLLKSS